MTYFEVITAILRELKYPTVSAFTDLTNPEHIQIMSIVNTINRDVLMNYGYNTRAKQTTLSIPSNSVDYYTTVENNINGEVKQNGIIVGKDIYNYVNDISKFYTENVSEFDYGKFGNNWLFKSKPTNRTATILYFTYNFAKDSSDNEKANMVLEDDTSIIPNDLQFQILVYGSCYNYKGSASSDKRLAYWLQQYQLGVRMLNDFNENQDANLKMTLQGNTNLRSSV